MADGLEQTILPPAALPKRESFRKRILEPAVLIGIAMSLVLHLLLLVVAALWIFGSGAPGARDVDSRGIDLAVMTSAELDALTAEAMDFTSPEVPELVTESTPDLELTTDLSTDLSGNIGELESLSESLGSGDIGESALSGTGSGAASFFGVEASGSRFAYIADISGSMSVQGKLEQLQVELIESIQGLNENAKFFICLYSDGPYPLGGQTKWTDASKQGLGWAVRLIRRIKAEGATNPYGAFETSFQLRPRPDAIFFMTDGEFNEGVANDVAKLNARFEIPIHCITFGSQRAQAVMEKIARDSGGTYHHVKGPDG
ncbi:MAG: hypothetical protein H6815_10975 [Phycisphaeraceae bacterium]|nr:hypothetical protein [Phycisphaerales bacterium]MCB9860958.1 hypothetical protein [Phycisphaeraceae bacterium]